MWLIIKWLSYLICLEEYKNLQCLNYDAVSHKQAVMLIFLSDSAMHFISYINRPTTPKVDLTYLGC